MKHPSSGRFLRAERVLAGLSLRALAARLGDGFSPASLSRLENAPTLDAEKAEKILAAIRGERLPSGPEESDTLTAILVELRARP